MTIADHGKGLCNRNHLLGRYFSGKADDALEIDRMGEVLRGIERFGQLCERCLQTLRVLHGLGTEILIPAQEEKPSCQYITALASRIRHFIKKKQ